MHNIELPEKLTFGSPSVKIDEFYVRESRGLENFNEELSTKLQFAFASGDDNDHIARLKLTVEAELIKDETIEIPLRAVFYSSIELLEDIDKKPINSFQSSDLPKPLLAMILGIALGTVRGELQVRTAGFDVGRTTLPIFNPTELVESMNHKNTSQNV